ncbi:hypothetical protein OF83DRAFT_1083205 [Amylostereum chailletii]|nr:hypothetical protein OF83DRAFT_1083205 [Amylostereum chailletii]
MSSSLVLPLPFVDASFTTLVSSQTYSKSRHCNYSDRAAVEFGALGANSDVLELWREVVPGERTTGALTTVDLTYGRGLRMTIVSELTNEEARSATLLSIPSFLTHPTPNNNGDISHMWLDIVPWLAYVVFDIIGMRPGIRLAH